MLDEYRVSLVLCNQSSVSQSGNQPMTSNYISLTPNLNILPSALIELIKEGVMVVSHNLQPVYLNLKARELCQQLWPGDRPDNLSSVMSDIYHRLCNSFSLEDKEFVMDYQISGQQIIRIRASYLTAELDVSVASIPDDRPCLLLFLEDRAAILAEELRLEQKKYGLSDRETEILKLLSQAYSYQDISQKLQISLNTVKFHVKNINGKKRCCLEPEDSYFAV
jgi:hypothetical protein